MIVSKRHNRPSSKSGYIFHWIAFLALTLSIADCLIKKAHSIPQWQKLKQRQSLRLNMLNLKRQMVSLVAHNSSNNKSNTTGESFKIDKTIVIDKITTIIQVRKVGTISCFHYESSQENMIHETEEHISSTGTETMSRTYKKISTKSSDNHKTLKRLIVERAKTSELNLHSLKFISQETIRQLYDLPQSKLKITAKWKKEIKRGVEGATENLKKYQ